MRGELLREEVIHWEQMRWFKTPFSDKITPSDVDGLGVVLWEGLYVVEIGGEKFMWFEWKGKDVPVRKNGRLTGQARGLRAFAMKRLVEVDRFVLVRHNGNHDVYPKHIVYWKAVEGRTLKDSGEGRDAASLAAYCRSWSQ